MVTWFGHDGGALARALDLPRVIALRQVDSTMDAAHAAAAEGAPAGTLVLAEEQRVGRGRGGKAWAAAPRAGLWLTLVERPASDDGLDVLSLRIGLRLADVLERWAAPIRLKWPNDVYVDGKKLAGVLVEARWRRTRCEWVAVGLGINLGRATFPGSATLGDADPGAVLGEVIPALRTAAFAHGPLRDDELVAFAARDLALGCALSAPAVGTARGIAPTGELLVETAAGVTPYRAGSLVLAHT
ncbi:MAG: biotin--[acetyl-CoA-carboxylase] ligase [Gemmatimonadaceae bacterium]